MDGLDFTVDIDKPYTNGIEALIKPMSFVKDMNFSVNTLKNLDKLINSDDDEDLLRNLETYKNQMNEIKLAKKAADRSKHDETSLNDNSFNDSSKILENGALAHESERKKISLKLKPTTTTIKHQTKELSNSFVDIEQQDHEQELSTQTQTQTQTIDNENRHITNEHNEQIEKRSSEGNSSSMSSSKKKSSHRKDERKSRRSEDRKSRRSEERNRTRRSEDRRSRRSEERKEEKRSKRNEEHRSSRRSEERHSRRSEERRPRRSDEEKRLRRSEERRSKRRHDRSPLSPVHHRDSYYSPSYRHRSMSPLPRGPRTPPNTPPPNATEFDEFRSDDMASMRHMPPYHGNHSMPPPSAHYQPGPNQFSAPNLPPNVPNYMNEYAAYMHPNRVPIPPHQYNRPPPSINTPTGMMPPPMGPNSEYYYHNTSSHAPSSHHLSNQSNASNSFSNLIEVSPYGTPNTLNIDYNRKPPEIRRKPTNAVQKGNVLEIVPSAELQCERNTDSTDIDKSIKVLAIENQHQQALLRQKQDRIKRKMERHQKRLEREKRKEYLLHELSRLSHLMTVGDDGKIVKASEILKSITFDGTNIKLENAKEIDEHDEQEDIYIEPQIYSYDPQAIVGKSILSERNDGEKISTSK